jgi:hypothetical protein
VPWTQIAITADFWFKRSAREAVVADILAGRLVPNDRGIVPVPFGLSAGGNEAMLEPCAPQACALFFTFRGIVDSYAGFLFVPDGSQLGDVYYAEQIPFGGNWFWVRGD